MTEQLLSESLSQSVLQSVTVTQSLALTQSPTRVFVTTIAKCWAMLIVGN